MPRAVRLPAQEFRARGYRTGATPYFSLKYKKNGARTSRIGVVVSIAVAKSAAKRNFWKRQANAVLDAVASSTPNIANDLLLIFSPKVNTLTKKQFREKLSAAAREAMR